MEAEQRNAENQLYHIRVSGELDSVEGPCEGCQPFGRYFTGVSGELDSVEVSRRREAGLGREVGFRRTG